MLAIRKIGKPAREAVDIFINTAVTLLFMPSWILFSVLAALIWAIVNTIDKYVLTKWIKKPIVPVMILGIVGLIASFIVYLVKGYSELSTNLIIINLIGGSFYVLGSLFYFQAAKLSEITRVVPLLHLIPLFVLVFAAGFLGEIFAPVKYIGVFLLVIGAVIISKKGPFKFHIGKAFWFMMLAVLAYSSYLIVTKYLLGFTDFWTVFSYGKIGGLLVLIPVFCFNYHKLKDVVKEKGVKVIWVVSLNESMNATGVLFLTIAASTGFITLVEGLASLQSLFLLIIATCLSIFYPKILKEEIRKSTVLLKLIAIILMIIGAYLVA